MADVESRGLRALYGDVWSELVHAECIVAAFANLAHDVPAQHGNPHAWVHVVQLMVERLKAVSETFEIALDAHLKERPVEQS